MIAPIQLDEPSLQFLGRHTFLFLRDDTVLEIRLYGSANLAIVIL